MIEAAEDEPPPQLLAVRQIDDALTYVECGRRLDQLIEVPKKFAFPAYYLLCHAIELALKAYLAASGIPGSTLRNEIGHDLGRALKDAQTLGLSPVDDSFPELVSWLAPYHLDHSFRYRKAWGFVRLPPAAKAADIIDNTARGIEPYVRSKFVEYKKQR
jgi:hypothetical protein